MKRYLIILFAALAAVTTKAQEDRFPVYADMVGKTIAFYDAQTHIEDTGRFLFVRNEKGKMIALKETVAFQCLNNGCPMKAERIVTIKDKQYLECVNGSETVYFLLSSKYCILPFFRSVTYWEEKADGFRRDCLYMKVDDKNNFSADDLILGKYVKLDWLGVTMPKELDGDVIFTYSCGKKSFAMPYRKMTGTDFASEAEFQKERERQDELARSIAEQERQDSLDDYVATVAYDLEAGDNDGLRFVYYVYGIDGSKASAYALGDNTVALDSLVFEDNRRKDFLIRRGEKGLSVRKDIARFKDSLQIERFEFVLDSLRNDVEQARANYFRQLNRKQIFIMKDLYSYSDYKFGKKFRFYNCFGKRIKYVAMTLTAYNGVGDVQRDDVGRYSAKLRGIGPIEKGNFAEYDWDDVFWDDRDVIKYVHVTNITFTFFDGTTRSYSGKSIIDKHKAGNCYEEDDE